MAAAARELELSGYSSRLELTPGRLELIPPIVPIGVQNHPAGGVVRVEGIPPSGDATFKMGSDHVAGDGLCIEKIGPFDGLPGEEITAMDEEVLIRLDVFPFDCHFC